MVMVTVMVTMMMVDIYPKSLISHLCGSKVCSQGQCSALKSATDSGFASASALASIKAIPPSPGYAPPSYLSRMDGNQTSISFLRFPLLCDLAVMPPRYIWR